MSEREDKDEVPSGQKEETPTVRSVSSTDLLQGGVELRIRHEGELYRLRRTSKGKLILTK